MKSTVSHVQKVYFGLNLRNFLNKMMPYLHKISENMYSLNVIEV